MALIRIAETKDWIVDYDKERGMYRASFFEDNHFQDEIWFDAYEEKEVFCNECVNCVDKKFLGTKYEDLICYKCKLDKAKDEFLKEFKETGLYKFCVKILDWLEKLLERK